MSLHPIEAHKLLQSWLLPSERILWAGRPRRGIRLSAADAFMIPFSLLWGGFALFWNFMVWAMDAPFFFRLFGLPFLVVGVHLIVGRFLVDAWRRGRTLYAVTNRRILVVRTGRLGRAEGHDLALLPGLQLVERRNRRGDIRFEPSSVYDRLHPAGFQPRAVRATAFEDVDGARAVHDLIRREAARARREAEAAA